MATTKALSTISKRELQTICNFSRQDAQSLHRYRLKVPVISDAEMHEASVNARTLHEQLGIGRDFSTWIKDKISQSRLVQGIDYEILLPESGEQHGGSNRIDYLLSVDTAKLLGMQTNTDTGDAIRRYFLLCEKALKELYLYNPSRIMTVKNKERLHQIYHDHFSDKKPEEFYSITNAVVSQVSTGVKPYRWKQAKMSTPANHLEGKDLSFYLSVQDTYLRALESGMSLSQSKELIETLYKDQGKGIFDKYYLKVSEPEKHREAS